LESSTVANETPGAGRQEEVEVPYVLESAPPSSLSEFPGPPPNGSYNQDPPSRLKNWWVVGGLALAALLLIAAGAAAVVLSSGGSSRETTGPNSSAGSSSGTSERNPSGPIVSRVVNGDALWLDKGQEKVRLVQIDAPDIATNQCYAQQSIAALQQLAGQGTPVALKPDPRLTGQDQYGRLLRYVYIAGKNVNLELVREGAAAPYFFFGQRGSEATRLLRAAKEAKQAGRGLWGDCPGTALDPNHEVKTS
jgi:micrococcal nuclease